MQSILFLQVSVNYVFDLSIYKFVLIHHVSINNCPWHLFNFKTLRCGAYWRAGVKLGRYIFQIKNSYIRKFQNFAIVSFQIGTRKSVAF